MKKIAYVHVGAAKAGSTSIQVLLRDRETDIATAGYHVPKSGRNPSGAHHLLFQSVNNMRSLPPRHWDNRGNVIEAFRAELSGLEDRPVVLSTEIISNVFMTRKTKSRHKWKLIDGLADILVQQGYAPVFVIVVRDALACINSRYSQLAKSFYTGLSFSDWLANWFDTRMPDLQGWTDYCEARDYGLRAIPYNRQNRGGGLIPTFLETVGLPKSLASETRANVNVGAAAIMASLTIQNRLGFSSRPELQSPDLMHRLRDVLLAAEQQAGNIGGRYWAPTEQQVLQIREVYQDDLDRFAQIHWGMNADTALEEDYAGRQSIQTVEDLDPALRQEHDRIVDIAWPAIQQTISEFQAS